MPSVIRERMQKLMDEQKAEATLPTSRAVMDFGEQEIDEPEQQETDTEPMDLPEQAPDEEVPASDESSADAGDDAVTEMDVPEAPQPEDKPDPGWEDSIDDMQRQFSGTMDDEEYRPAERGWQDEIGWQQSLADRSNSY